MPVTPTRAPGSIRSVLFDLDGTLLDTAPDLAEALNAVLVENNKPPLPFNAIRPLVSQGGIALIKLGFQLERSEPAFEPLRQRLLEIYRENVSTLTRPFPGITEVLDALEERGIHWGIVTNKPGWLTDPLLKDLQLYDRAVAIVSGDTLDERKPHPAPLLHACALADCKPQQCVYVGDAERDIQAGINAGMPTLVALFGYLQADDDPRSWRADGMLETPLDLLDWLDK